MVKPLSSSSTVGRKKQPVVTWGSDFAMGPQWAYRGPVVQRHQEELMAIGGEMAVGQVWAESLAGGGAGGQGGVTLKITGSDGVSD